jgi:hypothetical protein
MSFDRGRRDIVGAESGLGRVVGGWARGGEPRGLSAEVALLGNVGRPAGGFLESSLCGGAIAGLFVEVGANGVQAVLTRRMAVVVQPGERAIPVGDWCSGATTTRTGVRASASTSTPWASREQADPVT